MTVNTELVTIRINKELADILRDTAKQDNIKPTTYMRNILEIHAKEKRTLLNPKEPISIKQIQNSIHQIAWLYHALTKDLQQEKPKIFDHACTQIEKLFPEE